MEEIPSAKRNRYCSNRSMSDFWSEMQRLTQEQCLLSLATLEILQKRLFRAIERYHLPH